MKKVIGGIYIIRNKINGHFYLGRCEDFKDRKGRHWNNFEINDRKHPKLHDAVKSYGIKNFVFEPVLIVEGKQNQIKWEQIFLDCRFKENQDVCHYNISDNAEHGGNMGEEWLENISGKNHFRYGKKLSEEHKKKLSESKKRFYKENPDFQKGKNNPNYGRKHSKESKEKKSNSLKEYYKNNEHHFKGKKWSKEIIEKRANSLRGLKKTKEWKEKISKANMKDVPKEMIESIQQDREKGMIIRDIMKKYKISQKLYYRLIKIKIPSNTK